MEFVCLFVDQCQDTDALTTLDRSPSEPQSRSGRCGEETNRALSGLGGA
jgi:hypothetical protein